MFTITVWFNDSTIRSCDDLGINASFTHKFMDKVLQWAETNYPGAKVCGITVYPEDQRKQWEQMVNFINSFK
jgi:hypothetical protein